MAVSPYWNSLSISSSAPASRPAPPCAPAGRAKTCSNNRVSSFTVSFILSRTRPRVVRLSNRTTRITRRATSARYIDSFSPWWKRELKSVSPISFASWSLALKSAAARERLGFPVEIIGQETGGLHAGLARKIPKGREPAERGPVEELPAAALHLH